MKPALEGVVLLASLVMGAFVFRQCRAKSAPPVSTVREAEHPGADLNPKAVLLPGYPHSAPSDRSSTKVPRMKLASPPRPIRRESDVPPPVSKTAP